MTDKEILDEINELNNEGEEFWKLHPEEVLEYVREKEKEGLPPKEVLNIFGYGFLSAREEYGD